MGKFFSSANRSPDLGNVLQNWAKKRKVDQHKEAVRGFGNEVMSFINNLPPEQQGDLNVLKQGEAAIAKKYNLDIRDRQFAMDLITDHLNQQHIQEQRGQQKIQNEQQNTLFNQGQQDRTRGLVDEGGLKQLLNPKDYGVKGVDYSVPFDEGGVKDQMSSRGLLDWENIQNSREDREDKKTLFDLNKQNTQAQIDNQNYLKTRRPIEDSQKDSIYNLNKTVLSQQSTGLQEDAQVKKVLDEISGMGGRGDYRRLLSNQPPGVQRKVKIALADSKAKNEEKYLKTKKTEAEIALKNAEAIAKLKPKSENFERNKKAGDLILKQADRILKKYEDFSDDGGQPIPPEKAMKLSAATDEDAKKDWEVYTQLKRKADAYYNNADSAMGGRVKTNSGEVDLSEFDAGASQKKETPLGQKKLDPTKRADGTIKGSGFLGVLKTKSGKDMTEFSIGVNINGKETEIPTLVPTLTEKEKQFLLTEPKDIPKPIIDKAVAHAKKRIAKGKSPFFENEFSQYTNAKIIGSYVWADDKNGQSKRLFKVEKPEVNYGNRKYKNDKYEEYLQKLKQLGI